MCFVQITNMKLFFVLIPRTGRTILGVQLVQNTSNFGLIEKNIDLCHTLLAAIEQNGVPEEILIDQNGCSTFIDK